MPSSTGVLLAGLEAWALCLVRCYCCCLGVCGCTQVKLAFTSRDAEALAAAVADAKAALGDIFINYTPPAASAGK